MREVWAWWNWIRWTPVLVFVTLLFVGYIAPAEQGPKWVSYIWISVAILSILFAVLLLTKTSRIRRICQEEMDEDDGFRILMEIQHATTQLTVATHILFWVVGLVVLLIPDGEWRAIISRASIMDGQYMLFLIVALTYIAVLVVMRKIREALNKQDDVRLRSKAEDVLDKNLRRGRSNGA